MKLVAIIVLAAVLASGCVQYEGGISPYQYTNFTILSVDWAFEDQCQYSNASVAYANVRCSENTKCEVYVNGIRSGYGEDGLQACNGQLVVAEAEVSSKPEFVAEQNGDKYYYTRRDRNKNIEICCSFIDQSTNKLDRDYEDCQTARLDAQCLEEKAEGFDRLLVNSWEYHVDGTLSMTVANKGPQDAMIRRVYIENHSSIYSVSLAEGSYSPVITVTGGPRGGLGDSYVIALSIEYYIVSKSDTFYNSTGTLDGTYL
jgi:hypothetical protein